MKKIFNAAFAYMIIGVLSGLFYREFTKANDFPEGDFTQLGLVHTHLLTLGFIVLLIVLVLESNAMIAGIAGLGHIALSVGMVLLFLALRKRIVADRAVTTASAQPLASRAR